MFVHRIISYDSNVFVLIEMKLKSQIQMLKNMHIHTEISLIKENKKIIATLHEGHFSTIRAFLGDR